VVILHSYDTTMKLSMTLLFVVTLSVTFAQPGQTPPHADTQQYLWVTFFNNPITQTASDGSSSVVSDNSFMLIEQSRARANSFKFDTWVYIVDQTGEMFYLNDEAQPISSEIRLWLEDVRKLAIHTDERVFTDYQNNSLEWFWKLSADKGFVSVATWHSPALLTSWYADELLDSQPGRSTDDLRLEVLAFRHLLAHNLMDTFVLRDSASELFTYDAEVYEKDIGIGYLIAAQTTENPKERLEVWRDLQPYLR
jgi:hypothetical protein